jgi:hypothetical protein
MSKSRQLALAPILLLLSLSATHGQGGNPVELLDGELSHWTIENTTAGNFRHRDGVLEVREREGWLKSNDTYADFELVAEFRYLTDDADSGIFVRAEGQNTFARGWPNQSYQVQIRNPAGTSPFPPIGGLFRHARASGETSYNEDLARSLSAPTGEWQTLRLQVEGESLSVTLNGTEITRAAGLAVEPGFIGIQGETGALEFRAIRIRELQR